MAEPPSGPRRKAVAESPSGPQSKPASDVLEAVARATSAVAKDIVDASEARKRASATRKRWEPLAAAILVVAAIVLWVVFPPASDDQDPRSPDRIEMDLRMGVASIAQQIEDFRAAKGALPPTIEATGIQSPTVTYTRLGPVQYVLTGADHGATVTYRSTQPLADFSRGLFAAGAKR